MDGGDREEQPGTAAYGVALLSRYPATTWQVVRLPRIPVRFPLYLRAPGRVQVIHEEPRAAVVGHFDTPLGGITVVNTHLSFVPAGIGCSCVGCCATSTRCRTRAS